MISLSPTGGYTSFNSNTTSTAYLETGQHVLKLRIAGTSEFNIESFKFSLSANQTPSFAPIGAVTESSDTEIQLTLNKAINTTAVDHTHFSVTVNGNNIAVLSAQRDPNNPQTVTVSLNDYLSFYDEILISYSGDSLVSTNLESLAVFTNMAVSYTHLRAHET